MVEKNISKGTMVKKSLGTRGTKRPREVWVFGEVASVSGGRATVNWSSNYPSIDPASVIRGEPAKRQSIERVEALTPQPKPAS